MLTLSLYPYGLRRNEAFANPLVKQGFQTMAEVKAERAKAIAGFRNRNEGFQGGAVTVPAIPAAASKPVVTPPGSVSTSNPMNPSATSNMPPGAMPPGAMPPGTLPPVVGNTPPAPPAPPAPAAPVAGGGSMDASGNLVANAASVKASFTNYKQGFQNMPNAPASLSKPLNMGNQNKAGFQNKNATQNVNDLQGMQMKEGFASNYAETSGGAQDHYKPMGAFDGVVLPTGNSVSTWRYTAPNEELLGAPFAPGDDSLFIFKNNQCKPECCGSSFSCSGGCVCTTPDQRQLIAGRGGNRTKPQED